MFDASSTSKNEKLEMTEPAARRATVSVEYAVQQRAGYDPEVIEMNENGVPNFASCAPKWFAEQRTAELMAVTGTAEDTEPVARYKGRRIRDHLYPGYYCRGIQFTLYEKGEYRISYHTGINRKGKSSKTK